MADAAWTARSFLHRLDRAPAGRLALDRYLDSPEPELPAKVADRWTPLFPGSVVYSTWDAVNKLAPAMPALDALSHDSAAVRRLAVVLHAQEADNAIVAEPGVLLFGNSIEFSDAVHDGKTALHLQSPAADAADAALREYARQHSLPLLAERLDSALMFLPRACLPLAAAEGFLADRRLRDTGLPPLDRAVLALLLGAHGARPLPPDRYLASDARNANDARLAARRFGPSARHLLYARGMPRLWRTWNDE